MAPAYANPYQRLLCRSLEALHVQPDLKRLGPRAMCYPYRFRSYDLIHLHWLNPFYHSKQKWKSLLAAYFLVRWLKKLTKKYNIPVIATVHNIRPHKSNHPKLDDWIIRKIYNLCDTLIFHSQKASDEFIKEFGDIVDTKHEVIPHALYPASLVPKPSQKEARDYFGIPQSCYCIFYFGQARIQKGYDLLLEAVPTLAKNNMFVLMAGKNLPKLASDSVLTLPYFVPEEEIPVLLSAADVVALPYRRCTTSGVATLALGAGVPVAVSNLPIFRPLVNQGIAKSCDFTDPHQLSEDLATAIYLGQTEDFNMKIREYVKNRSWDDIATKTNQVYRKILKNRTTSKYD